MILLDASLRISVVAVIAALILTIMRVRASSVRHAVWRLVLIAMLIMPLLPSIVPTFAIPVVVSAPAGMLARSDIASEPAPPMVVREDRTAVVPIVNRAGADRPVAGRRSQWSIVSIASAVYGLGAIVLVLRLIVGWFAAARLIRHASAVSHPCGALVRESALVATPMTAGVLAPAIILPSGWTEWPAEKLRACIAHELAHIRRRDPLVAFIAHLNRCIFWFHPLAWWLDRTLAATAEDAADEAAVHAIGDRRQYAEVLLGIAEAVHVRGARVAWQGVGVGGSGRVGRRIDRVLRGDAVLEISGVRKAVVFMTCAAAIVIVVSCRQQQTVSALQPDPQLAEQLKKDKERGAFYESAKNLTAAEVDALEASLKRTPEDFETLRKLQIFYQWSGQTVFGWNEMIARRRVHLLWLIENYPDHELAMRQVSAEADPIGYAEAKKRWLDQTAKPDASARVLTNAAYFIERADPAIAEQMLLRAKAMTAGSEHARGASERLGSFYGNVVLGPTDPRDGSLRTRIDSVPYARHARQQLADSNDAVLLLAAGARLAQTYRDEDRRQLGRQLLERALQIDPQQMRARALLVTFDAQERSRRMNDRIRRRAAVLAGGEIAAKLIARQRLTPEEDARLREAEPQAVAELPESERFAMLPELAIYAYWGGESRDWNKDRAAAEASFARSKQYAQETLVLAPKFRNDSDYGKAVYHARIALALHSLRDGDRSAAVRRMLEAVNVPSSRGLEAYSFGLDQRLVNYLLKTGERATVAEFLERSADLRPADREQLIRDAAAIRTGRMPMSFQYTTSRQ